MDGLSMPGNASMFAELHHPKIQKYAKIAAALFLLSIIGGGFGEIYVPTTLIVRDYLMFSRPTCPASSVRCSSSLELGSSRRALLSFSLRHMLQTS